MASLCSKQDSDLVDRNGPEVFFKGPVCSTITKAPYLRKPASKVLSLYCEYIFYESIYEHDVKLLPI